MSERAGGVLPRIGVPSAKKTKKRSEKTVKPQTPGLPVGKGPESRKTVPSRKLPVLSHRELQGQTEEGSGYLRWGCPLKSSPILLALYRTSSALGLKTLPTGSILLLRMERTSSSSQLTLLFAL